MLKIIKIFLNSICLISFLVVTPVFANTNDSPKATFSLIKNSDDGQNFTATLALSGLPRGGDWEIGFDSVHPVLSLTNNLGSVVQEKQTGDFFIFKFSIPKDSRDVTFNFTGQWFVKKYGDAPIGYFLIDPQTQNTISLKQKTILPDTLLHPWTSENEYAANLNKNNAIIDGNKPETSLTPETSLIVPLPVKLIRRNNSNPFVLNDKTHILVADANVHRAATFFNNAIKNAMGYQFNTVMDVKNSLANSILLTSNFSQCGMQLTNSQQKEGYVLKTDSDSVVICAHSEAGFFYGLQTLRQLLPPEIFSDKMQHPKKGWIIPNVLIVDYPRFSYRGLHLDVARHFIPKEQVKRLLDVMAIHKLNYFEWHLTDDEGWRIEISAYPQLTQIGSKRGYNLPVVPSFGTGATPYGGYYTKNDISEIVAYAADRHITIIPEIDVPGHARAMIMSLPDQLIDKNDHSEYTSVQGYHDNVLSACDEEKTDKVLRTIFTEVAAQFPGKYIHIGGDEVPNGAWTKSATCLKAGFSPDDPKFKSKIQDYFLSKIQQIISDQGKIMAGWEEIAGPDSSLKKPLRVYIWNTGKIAQTYKKSVENGYEIIMSPAEHLYFDLSYNADPSEPGQYWAGYVDTFSAYSFSPIAADQNNKVIQGIQGELWSEIIDSRDRLDYLGFPKVAALAEVAWSSIDNSSAYHRNWRNFSERMGILHLPRLEYYGLKYRLSPPGVHIANSMLYMNNEFKGLTLRYTTDGTIPNVNSPEFLGPVKISSLEINARSFSVTGRW